GKSAFFRGALEEFLKQGGTLVVFAQQHGYDFSVLPVPEEPDGTFNRVGGYGWTEDQACFTNSAYIDTWHQILSGQNRATPTLNVDGYFTLYPSTSTVLLRRTQNHQPVMLLYEYGPGRVIVSSLYSDYAFGRSQASSEEIALIRDVVTWAKAPAELSETEPGGTVTVQVTVKNFAAKDAASVKFYVYPPNRDEVLGSQAATVAVPAGQSATIPVTAPSSSALGIYHIDYELIDSNGDVIQPEAETDSGRFVASNPPDDAYQPSSSFKVWVTTTTDRVTEGSDVTFTIHIKNNTSSDLVDGQIGIGSHEAGGKHWIYRETITGVNINAGQTAEVAWTFRIDLSQAVYFGLFRADQNADSYFLKGGLARAERGVRIL
ncbi:MAG: hypothetical protein FJY85_22490, partial [Deltaproteobacteria bacterium]|nr:hypothetical protein [Deltaproteobacteria bacterium]